MINIIDTRITNLRQSITESQLDALLILIDENRRYLSGYTGEDTGYDESAGALLITPDELFLLTDSRFTLQAQMECPNYQVITYKKGLAKELTGLLAGLETNRPLRFGYEKRKMSCEQFETLQTEISSAGLSTELVGTVNLVEKFRIIKTGPEIDAMKSALAIAEKALLSVMEILEPGMREKELAWALEKQMREAGADAVSFSTIVAGGPNAALPHAIPGPMAIKPDQPVLFDWGARLNGYCSDTSRTLFTGKPDSQFKKIFNAVYDAQQRAIEAVRPGAYSCDIDAAARDVLKDKGLDTFFGHGLGHGIGLAVHEQPSISPVKERNTRLEENMVFTIEPGVYIPDWGGVRLENMVVVRQNGPEVLNTLKVALG